MIQYTIPKTSTFLSTLSSFVAAFNVPTPGKYDFGVPVNQDRQIFPMNTGSIYFINRMTIGATIPQESYLANIINAPTMTLKLAKERQRVYPLSISLVQFVDGYEACAWFWSTQGGDTPESLSISVSGLLSQDANLIGVPSVTLNITFSIFEITDSNFVRMFLTKNDSSGVGFRPSSGNDGVMYVDE